MTPVISAYLSVEVDRFFVVDLTNGFIRDWEEEGRTRTWENVPFYSNAWAYGIACQASSDSTLCIGAIAFREMVKEYAERDEVN